MTVHLLHLKNYPIYQLLKLEEALLRTDNRNWCILNEGSPRTIVMGISGKPQHLLNTERVKSDNVPLIKRFSGGGTVIVDNNTIFATFLFNKIDHPAQPFPEPILRWSENLYRKAFDIPSFQLRENDFVIGENKCGGNAQYIQKSRWLLHTSFLWDFSNENMDYLLYPKKVPKYRASRSHEQFLCKMKDAVQERPTITESIRRELEKHFSVAKVNLEEILSICDQPHRKSTMQIII